MAQRGVRVRILTNSLAATDEASVHAGYAQTAQGPAARAGVQLFEIKPDRERRSCSVPATRSARIRRPGCTPRPSPSTGARIFVGSFNFDPRSAKLNTEMGLVIDSASLAEPAVDDVRYRLAGARLPGHARRRTARCRVARRPRRTLDDEPETSWGRRIEGPDLLLAADRVAAAERPARSSPPRLIAKPETLLPKR